MAEKESKRPSQSLQRIKRLVELMNSNSLCEFEFEEPNFRVRLVKSCSTVPQSGTAPTVTVPQPGSVSTVSKPGEEKDGEKNENYIEIKSPIVGTFYRSPAPDAPPYVNVGDHVNPKTVVCIVEAMKVMNELKADCSGTIVKILAENAQTVEYGHVLFLVKPD
ncbi:MAG: acetyl-CoA carboxylase biotin carboxyl carrier protein [Planctomycetota bacterium]